jgi:hypothetical protein
MHAGQARSRAEHGECFKTPSASLLSSVSVELVNPVPDRGTRGHFAKSGRVSVKAGSLHTFEREILDDRSLSDFYEKGTPDVRGVSASNLFSDEILIVCCDSLSQRRFMARFWSI